ncbi:MAG: hypothetical protein EXX96DRAFT_608022 [Benjaminiella poitrasii]|nr:MAG: hypothetical protein EXX96DRAFT_608022 [Benjaminiella poitrasii]
MLIMWPSVFIPKPSCNPSFSILSSDEENTDDDSDEEDIADNPNYATRLQKFRNEAKSQGLFVNENLQQLLALNDILLLEIEDSSRKNIKCQIFKLYEAADDLDTKILVIFLSYMDRLPDEPLLNHTIKEIELITKFLDPVLNGMLNDYSTNHSFQWTNTRSTGTEDERPDGEMVILKQRTIDYTVGYCEVRISASSSNSVDIHNDILRLASFGKRLCDEENFIAKYAILFSVYSTPNFIPQQRIQVNVLYDDDAK